MTGEGRPRRTDPRRGSAASPSRGASAPSDVEITLRAMRFHALVGVLDHERSMPQPIEVDLTAWCHAGGDVVDYRRLYEIVQSVLAGGPIDYLEDIGDRVASRVLGDERVQRVRIAVRKPHVALPGPLAHAEVVVQRRRGEES